MQEPRVSSSPAACRDASAGDLDEHLVVAVDGVDVGRTVVIRVDVEDDSEDSPTRGIE
jgi:hypothetical protein